MALILTQKKKKSLQAYRVFKNAKKMLDIDMSLFLAVFIITFCVTEFSAGFLSVMSFPIQVLNALSYCTSIP